MNKFANNINNMIFIKKCKNINLKINLKLYEDQFVRHRNKNDRNIYLLFLFWLWPDVILEIYGMANLYNYSYIKMANIDIENKHMRDKHKTIFQSDSKNNKAYKLSKQYIPTIYFIQIYKYYIYFNIG